MTKKNKDTSSTKKLISAVAMLTTSAIMLTTSTYAWFTLNKEVEVTGLKMAAVAGDSLEITLGKLGVDTKGQPDNTTFGTVGDLGWCRAEAIDSYYNVIGKLKPVSSATGNKMFKVNEEKIYAGGQAVEEGAEVTLLTDDTNRNFMPVITLDNTYGDVNLTNGEDDENSKGYYVDIPMWIRSNVSGTEGKNVNAWVKITNPTIENENGATQEDTNPSELINAVRVALIPVASTSSLKDSGEVTKLNYTQSAEYTSTIQTPTIFALNKETYASKGVLSNAGSYSDTIKNSNPSIVDAVDSFKTNDNFEPTLDGTKVDGTTIFTMPAAKNDDYAAVLVVARIWIEGESTYCNDATANQDWSIDFHFEFADDTQQN